MTDESPDDELKERIRRLLDRVEKLQAKARDKAVTRQEAESLMLKAEAFSLEAAELMAEHSLTELIQEASQREEGTAYRVAERTIRIKNPYARQKASLASRIARALNAEPVIVAARNAEFEVAIVAAEDDLERIERLYKSLLQTALLGMAAAEVPPGQGVKSFRRAFLIGFGKRVASRLRMIEQHTRTVTAAEYDARRPDAAPSMEVALVDRATAVERRFNQLYPPESLGTFRVSTTCDVGLSAGREAGDRADLGTTSTGSARRAEVTA